MHMSPKTLTGVCAITLMGVLAAGCSSSSSPKKSATPTKHHLYDADTIHNYLHGARW